MAKIKSNKIILFGAGIAALLLSAREAANNFISKFRFGTPKVSFGSFSGLNVPVRLVIPVINSNTFDLNYQGLEMTLFYGADAIGKVTDLTGIALKASSTTNIDITIKVSVFSAALAIQDAIKTGNYTQALKVSGIIRISGVPVPYSQKLQII